MVLKFEDIADISDRDMESISKEIPVPTLIRALKMAPHNVREKLLKSIRPAFAEMFSDMAAKQAEVSDAEATGDRETILEIVRHFRRT